MSLNRERLEQGLDNIDDEFLSIYLKNNKIDAYNLPITIIEKYFADWKINQGDKSSELKSVEIDNEVNAQASAKCDMSEELEGCLYKETQVTLANDNIQLQTDKEKLTIMKETISKVMIFLDEYISIDKLFHEKYTKLADAILELIIRYLQVVDFDDNLNKLIEQMYRKEIYLEYTSHKNFIIKALRCIYTRGVKKDLDKLNGKYKKVLEEYNIAINQYNHLSSECMTGMKTQETLEKKKKYKELSSILDGYKHLQVAFDLPYDDIVCDISLKELKNANDSLIVFYSKCQFYIENINKASDVTLVEFMNDGRRKMNELDM